MDSALPTLPRDGFNPLTHRISDTPGGAAGRYAITEDLFDPGPPRIGQRHVGENSDRRDCPVCMARRLARPLPHRRLEPAGHPSLVLVGQMGVPAGHCRRRVSEGLHELALGRSGHRQIAGVSVPQIVETENLRFRLSGPLYSRPAEETQAPWQHPPWTGLRTDTPGRPASTASRRPPTRVPREGQISPASSWSSPREA